MVFCQPPRDFENSIEFIGMTLQSIKAHSFAVVSIFSLKIAFSTFHLLILLSYFCQNLTSQNPKSMNSFGDRVKELREKKQLLQKHIAGKLDIDTPMLSKIERGERRAKREQVLQLAEIFDVDQNELIVLWLADKVYEVIKDEDVASSALRVAEKNINTRKKPQNHEAGFCDNERTGKTI